METDSKRSRESLWRFSREIFSPCWAPMALANPPRLGLFVPCCVKPAGRWRYSASTPIPIRSEEHTSELQLRGHLVCRLLLEKKKIENTKKNLHSYSKKNKISILLKHH